MSTIAESDRAKIADAAGHLLADSYTLYLKTHNFHWNVKGPMFTTLHTMFETQYTELALAVDEIAERIRSVGFPAPASYTEFQKLAKVKESVGPVAAMDMIEELTRDQETIVATARNLKSLAESAGDDASADLAVRRINIHEKNAWMLRSHLE
jgi:starvation-inducible DNA-binding protein